MQKPPTANRKIDAEVPKPPTTNGKTDVVSAVAAAIGKAAAMVAISPTRFLNTTHKKVQQPPSRVTEGRDAFEVKKNKTAAKAVADTIEKKHLLKTFLNTLMRQIGSIFLRC